MHKRIFTCLFVLGLFFCIGTPPTNALSLDNQSVTASVSSFFSSFLNSLSSFFAPLFYQEPTPPPQNPSFGKEEDTPPSTHTPPVTTSQEGAVLPTQTIQTIIQRITTPGITQEDLTLALNTLRRELGPQQPQTEVRGFSGDGLTSSINQVVNNITNGNTTGTYTGGFTGTVDADTLSSDSGLLLSSYTPVTTSNLLYNTSGDLYWAGNLLAGSAVGNWASNGTDVWRSGGNVGVGTTSPFAKLSVSGNGYFDGNITSTNLTATGTAQFGPGAMQSGNAGDVQLARSGTTGALYFGSTGGKVIYYNGSAFTFNDNITTTGNVGVGTASPGAKLQINGDASSITSIFRANATSPGYITLWEDSTGLDLAWIDADGSGHFGQNAGYITSGGDIYGQRLNAAINLSVAGGPIDSGEALGVRPRGAGLLGVVVKGLASQTADLQQWQDSTGAVLANVTAAGNVGIGTTTPTAKLTVADGFGGYINLDGNTINGDYQSSGDRRYSLVPTGTGLLSLPSGHDGGALVLASGGSKSVISGGGQGYGQLSFFTGNDVTNARMMIGGTGNVGIGTTNPQGKLDINAATVIPGSGYGGLTLRSSDAVGANKGGVITFGGLYSGGADADWAGIAGLKENGTNGQYGGYLSFYTRSNGFASSERLRITSAGNVGIGTTNPGAKLQIDTTVGGTDALILRDATNDKTARFFFSAPIGQGPDLNIDAQRLFVQEINPISIAAPSGTTDFPIGNQSGTTRLRGQPVQLQTYGGNTVVFEGSYNSDTIVRPYSNSYNIQLAPDGGNVGIGSTTPEAKLAVDNGSGGVASNGFLIRNSSNSGYTLLKASTFYTDGNGGNLLDIANQSGSALFINSSRNVGIGTASPNSNLTVGDDLGYLGNYKAIALGNTTGNTIFAMGQSSDAELQLRWDYNVTQGSAIANLVTYGYSNPLRIDASVLSLQSQSGGNVGIKMSDPSVALDVTGDIEYTGTITDVSDQRLKENITDFGSGLDILKNIDVKNYNMIASPGKPETGFIAQNVQQYFPSAVSIVDPKNGYMGVSYVSFIPVLTRAIQEIANITGSFRDSLMAWFASSANGIHDFFTNTSHQKTLCVGDVGSETCITKTQLDGLLQNAGQPVTTYGPTGSGEEQQGGSEEVGSTTPSEEGEGSQTTLNEYTNPDLGTQFPSGETPAPESVPEPTPEIL